MYTYVSFSGVFNGPSSHPAIHEHCRMHLCLETFSDTATMPFSCQTKLLSKHVVCMSQGPGRKTDGLFKRGN